MKKKNNSKLNIKSNKGVTGVDLVVAIIILTMFVGLLTTLMVNLYKQALEIQKSANAMSYVTIICEMVDEKSFNDVTAKDSNGNYTFVTNLKNSGEVTMADGYDVEYKVENIPNKESTEINSMMQKVSVRVSYDVQGETQSIYVMKLKVKEIAK